MGEGWVWLQRESTKELCGSSPVVDCGGYTNLHM